MIVVHDGAVIEWRYRATAVVVMVRSGPLFVCQ